MGKKHMTGREINTMLRMYERGESAEAIGKAIDRNPSVVTSTLCRYKKQLSVSTQTINLELADVLKHHPQEVHDEIKEILNKSAKKIMEQKPKPTSWWLNFLGISPRN